MEPPEAPSVNFSPPKQPAIPQPTSPPATATTTTAKPPIVRTETQGSEKGPSSPALAYYASRLTDANINAQKGPPPESMSYYPEQFQYMQAQGTPGLRGPPGPPGPIGQQGSVICFN